MDIKNVQTRTLTGIKDVDLKILKYLDDRDLLNFCSTGKYGKQLCENEFFWNYRLEDKFPDLYSYKPQDMSFKNYYLSLIKTYSNIEATLNEYVWARNSEIGSRDPNALKKNESLVVKSVVNDRNLPFLKYLVDQGFHINAILESASLYGYMEAVKYSLEKGADINTRNNDALRKAALGGNFEIFKYLVSRGADMYNTLDPTGDTALIYAIESGSLDIVKYMVENGVDINEEDIEFPEKTPLSLAVKYGNLEIIKYLLEKGANKDVVALSIKHKRPDLSLAKYLIDNGAKMEEGNLEYIVKYLGNSHKDFIKYIIDRYPQFKNKILEIASKWGNLNLVTYLLNNISDFDGNDKALLYAVKNKKHDVVKYLVENRQLGKNSLYSKVSSYIFGGTKFYDKNKLGDALKYSAENGDLILTRYLVDKGAEIRNSTLINAIDGKNLEVLKYLLDKIVTDDVGSLIDEVIMVTSPRINKPKNKEILSYLLEKRNDLWYRVTKNTEGKLRNGY